MGNPLICKTPPQTLFPTPPPPPPYCYWLFFRSFSTSCSKAWIIRRPGGHLKLFVAFLRLFLSSVCGVTAHIVLLGNQCQWGRCLIYKGVWADDLCQVGPTWMSSSRVSSAECHTVERCHCYSCFSVQTHTYRQESEEPGWINAQHDRILWFQIFCQW